MQLLKGLFFFTMQCTFYGSSLAQQLNIPAAKVISINSDLTAHRYEFSSLAKWKNKILLVPQNRKNVIDSIYMIDSLEIINSMQQHRPASHDIYIIKNLRHDGASKNLLYIDNVLLKNYDGFEAAVTKGDTIFFSLETTTSFGYIIKGIINEETKSVNILPDTLHIPNPYKINNAGYESLALLPGKNSLITFFECNKDTDTTSAYIFNPDLKNTPTALEWAKPLYFRLADVYAINDSVLLGINRLFTVPFYTAERNAYIEGLDLTKVKEQLTNGGTIDKCFAQIIKIIIRKNKLYWQPVEFISLNILDNYEGIVPFNKGVLMIVDGEPGNAPCKFVYAPLKNF